MNERESETDPTRRDQNTQQDQNTQGVPDGDTDADTASGGAPEPPDTTDENGRPLDNPSGG